MSIDIYITGKYDANSIVRQKMTADVKGMGEGLKFRQEKCHIFRG